MAVEDFELAFVDSVVASPTMRLDLSASPWLVQRGTRFDPPDMKRVVIDSMLVDGEVIPASAYTNREITLIARIDPTLSDDEVAEELQGLYRELDRPFNFLRYRLGTTEAVTFKTYRCSPTAVTFDLVLREVQVSIPADSTGYSPVESLGSFAISGNPSSGTMYAEIGATTIKGDVETPLIIDTPQAFVAQAVRQAAFGTLRRADGFSSLPGYTEAETGTLGTDASLQTNASFSNTALSNNAVRVTFAGTATNAKRLSFFSVAGAQARGRWRVYARVKKSVAGDGISLQLAWGNDGTGTAVVFNDAVTLPATASIIMVDLGYMTFPWGTTATYSGYSGVEMNASGGWCELWAARTSGAGNVEIDFFYFIPALDKMTLISYPTYGNGAGPRLRWDGPNGVVYENTVSGGVSENYPIPIIGAEALMVSPGMVNRIYALREVTPGMAVTLNSTTYTMYYYPRYLMVRPPLT